MNNLEEITNTAKVTYSYIVESAREEVIGYAEATVSNPFLPQPRISVFMRAQYSCDPANHLIYYIISIKNQSSITLNIQLIDSLPGCLELEGISIDGKVSDMSNMSCTGIQIGEIQPEQIISVVISTKVKNITYQERICNQGFVIATYNGTFQTTYASNETTVLVQNQPTLYSANTYIRACPPIKPIYKVDYVNTGLFNCSYRYFVRRVNNKVCFYVRITGMLQVVIHYRSRNDRVYSYQYVTKYSQNIRINEMRMECLSKDFLQFDVKPVQILLAGAGCRIAVRTVTQKKTLTVM